jgi:hypothetical protein
LAFAFPFLRLKATSIAFFFARVRGRLTITMKPHPKIRKTIKWGGAAVTLLLAAVWVVSLGLIITWIAGPTDLVHVDQGVVRLIHRPHAEQGTGFRTLRPPGIMKPVVSFRWSSDARGWSVRLPLWPAIGVACVATLVAWRLDTLARRRERLGRCPKCNYDRAGIAAGAVCPECGDRPTIG